MATTDELLEIMEAETSSEPVTNDVYEINPETRKIEVPADLLLGVESDEDVTRIYFTCPKIVGDNIDLTSLQLRVNYANAKGDKKYYTIADVTESQNDPDKIVFSWLLAREVTSYKGDVTFIVCAVKRNGIEIVNEWNTIAATGKVLAGLEVDVALDTTISMVRGDTLIADLLIYDTTNNPYPPVTGDVLTFSIKRTVYDEQPVLSKIIPTDSLKLTLTPNDTRELEIGNYVYDVCLAKADGEVHTIVPSSVFVLRGEVH